MSLSLVHSMRNREITGKNLNMLQNRLLNLLQIPGSKNITFHRIRGMYPETNIIRRVSSNTIYVLSMDITTQQLLTYQYDNIMCINNTHNSSYTSIFTDDNSDILNPISNIDVRIIGTTSNHNNYTICDNYDQFCDYLFEHNNKLFYIDIPILDDNRTNIRQLIQFFLLIATQLNINITTNYNIINGQSISYTQNGYNIANNNTGPIINNIGNSHKLYRSSAYTIFGYHARPIQTLNFGNLRASKRVKTSK
jgi:hypothetical protein